MWWCKPVMPALRRWRQEDGEFKASLFCMAKPFSGKKVKLGIGMYSVAERGLSVRRPWVLSPT
jgi:hypothetical protein